MQGGRGQEGVDAGMAGVLHGLPAAVNVAVHAAAQTGDLNVARLFGDLAHGIKVALAGGGETGFHDVHAQHFELMGEAQFFLLVHGGAGGLLAVAEGGIKEIDAIGHDGCSSCELRGRAASAGGLAEKRLKAARACWKNPVFPRTLNADGRQPSRPTRESISAHCSPLREKRAATEESAVYSPEDGRTRSSARLRFGNR